MSHPKKIEVTPEITRQMATRRAVGATLRDLEQEFGFSRPVVNRVLSTDMAKAVVKGLIEDAVGSAVIEVRRGMADMATVVTKVLRKHLEDDSLEAVKIVLKGLGMDAVEKTDVKQAQTFTVILPGQQAAKEIEVESEQ